MVISRDVNLDESVFGFLSTSLDEDIDELNFLDLISIPILLQIRSTSRQKSEKVAQVKIKTYQENHAPFDTKWFLKKQVRRLTRMTDDEKNDYPDDKASSLLFWRASANVIEGSTGLTETKTFRKAANRPQ